MIHQPGYLIKQRYQILEPLGRGGSGLTYKARDLQSDRLVAVKVLSLTHLDTWKQIELFEREVKILQQLNHPSVPKYLDRFQVDTEEGDLLFYIIQQLAPGKSLATLIEEGWQPDEPEVKQIATQILEILASLQDLIPPIIHRDIKPQNIIYGNQQLFLVDFGAVQDIYHQTAVGSTVVGTYGYMAPEQFRGQAQLSTDLYGLGTTILFLLTGTHPADLPYHKLKIDFRSRVRVSKPFANWIEKLIEPDPKQRCTSAREALEVLQGKHSFAQANESTLQPPSYTSISLQKAEDTLTITIPPALFRQRCHRWRLGLGGLWYFIVAIAFIICAAFLPPLWGWLYVSMFVLSLFAFNSSIETALNTLEQLSFPKPSNLYKIKSSQNNQSSISIALNSSIETALNTLKQLSFPKPSNLYKIKSSQNNQSSISIALAVLIMPFKILVYSLINIVIIAAIFLILIVLILFLLFVLQVVGAIFALAPPISSVLFLFLVSYLVYLFFELPQYQKYFKVKPQSQPTFISYKTSIYSSYSWLIAIQVLLLTYGLIVLIQSQLHGIIFMIVLILDFLIGTSMKRTFISKLFWTHKIQASWRKIKGLEHGNLNQTSSSHLIFKVQSKLFKLPMQEIPKYIDKISCDQLYQSLKSNQISNDLSKELHSHLLTKYELDWLLSEVREFIKRSLQHSGELLKRST